MKIVLVLFVLVAAIYAELGVDVSVPISTSVYQCLNKAGYDFAVVRCFRSTGTVDSNCADSVNNAHGQMNNVDLYMFPCPKCSASGEEQVQTLLQYVKSNGLEFNRIWLDIEDATPAHKYWSASPSTNQAFFQSLVSGASSAGVDVGVYTDATMWNFVMGTSYTGASNLPLWYSHYNGQPNFNDFQSFGGWSQPTMKQYNGNKDACGVGLDMNFIPGGSKTSTAGHSTTASHSASGPSAAHSAAGHSSTGGHSGSSSSTGPASSSGSGNSTNSLSSSGNSTGNSLTSGNSTGSGSSLTSGNSTGTLSSSGSGNSTSGSGTLSSSGSGNSTSGSNTLSSSGSGNSTSGSNTLSSSGSGNSTSGSGTLSSSGSGNSTSGTGSISSGNSTAANTATNGNGNANTATNGNTAGNTAANTGGNSISNGPNSNSASAGFTSTTWTAGPAASGGSISNGGGGFGVPKSPLYSGKTGGHKMKITEDKVAKRAD